MIRLTKKICIKAVKSSTLCYLNLPKHISNHIFGKHHSQRHRMISGTVVVFVGALLLLVEGNHVVKVICELFGTSFHGIGFHPIIEYFQKSEEE